MSIQEISKEISELLQKPFPKDQIKTRKGRGNRYYKYVPQRHIAARLDSVLHCNWSFVVVEQKQEGDEIIVLGCMTIFGISKMQYGGKKIAVTTEGGEVVSLRDDYKSAASDAMKKCASLFGVGRDLDVERGESEEAGKESNEPTNGRDPRQPPSGTGTIPPESPGSPGNGAKKPEDMSLNQLLATVAFAANTSRASLTAYLSCRFMLPSLTDALEEDQQEIRTFLLRCFKNVKGLHDEITVTDIWRSEVGRSKVVPLLRELRRHKAHPDLRQRFFKAMGCNERVAGSNGDEVRYYSVVDIEPKIFPTWAEALSSAAEGMEANGTE